MTSLRLKFKFVCLCSMACIGSLSLIIGCKTPTDDPTAVIGWDRKAMLTHYYDQLILPSFETLASKSQTLNTAIEQFSTNPNAQNLETAQKSWVECYTAWMAANAYNFGPTGEDGIRKGLIEEIGTFPVSEAKIETNIADQKTTFNDFNRDNRGFLTLEYLLFSKGQTTVLTNLQNESRRAYLKAVMSHTNTNITEALKAWKAYKAEFLSKYGTDAGSSTSQLYNEFVRSYESVKNFKVSLPLGLRAGQTKAQPELAEGYYSGKSLVFIKAHLTAIENFYYGKGQIDGPGFKEYLETVEGGKALIVSTEAQLLALKTSLSAVPANGILSDLIVSNPTTLVNLHTELQKQTRFFKSDMSSVLGIAITFSSGDGD